MRFVVNTTAMTAVAFAAAVGLFYGLTTVYFEAWTDQALHEALVREYAALNLALPDELAAADLDGSWIDALDWEEDEDEADADAQSATEASDPIELDDLYDDVGIIVHSLDAQAQMVALTTTVDALGQKRVVHDQKVPNALAVRSASHSGTDIRTVINEDGHRVRLLTHRMPTDAPMPFLQLSRLISIEEALLRYLMVSLALTGVVVTGLVASISWRITGRSIRLIKQAWNQQQTFLSNTNHELRMPLTLIRASTEVALRQLAGQPVQQHLLADVLEATDHMSQLTNDLLLLSRVDAGQLKLNLQKIDLAEFLPRLCQQLALLAEQRGVTMRINQAEGIVQADPTRLRQILLNVADNALRHTPPGGSITIDTQRQARWICLCVADTGEGIASEALPHVFERFYRVVSSRTAHHSVGLGLSIARMLTELHHGQISIESQVGVGTRVTIKWPAG